MNVGNIIAKTAGIAGIGLIGYDAHQVGKIQAATTQKGCKADSLADSYVNTMGLDCPSSVASKVKKALFNVDLEENMTDFFTGIAGYVKGATSMVVSNVIPAGLAVGALLTKGWFSKASAIGLGAYGLIYLIQNTGFTNHKEL